MKDFLMRLSSRKFLVTVAGIWAVTQFPAFTDDIVKLVGFYVVAEGSADVVQRYAVQKTTQNAKKLTAELYAGGVSVPLGFDGPNPTPPPNTAPGQTFVPGQ